MDWTSMAFNVKDRFRPDHGPVWSSPDRLELDHAEL